MNLSADAEGAGRRTRIWIAYTIVSIVWGSTYLAIKIGVAEVPPFWMAGVRLVAAGVILAGIAVLVDPRWSLEGGSMPFIAVAVIMVGANAWSGGSVLSKRRLKEVPPLVSASIHSLTGGLFLLLIDLLVRHDPLPHITARAWGSILYLVIFGSVLAYSAYIYLVKYMPPAKAGTFTFINPVVAVFLGWLVLNEELSWRLLVGGIMIFIALLAVRRSQTGRKVPVPMSGPGRVNSGSP